MKTTLKDWPKIYRKLKGIHEMTGDERIQFARATAATPDERWQMNTNCIKALGFAGRVRSLSDLECRKAKLRRLESPRLWALQVSDEEVAAGQVFGTALLKEVL